MPSPDVANGDTGRALRCPCLWGANAGAETNRQTVGPRVAVLLRPCLPRTWRASQAMTQPITNTITLRHLLADLRRSRDGRKRDVFEELARGM